MYLFVYGTLMRGYGNNHLLKDAEFFLKGYVQGSLYGFGVPGFIPSKEHIVYGEIYKVPNEGPLLDRIDALEGHPNNYVRTAITCYYYGVEEDYELEAMVYVYPRAKEIGELIPSGRYQDYRAPRTGTP